jgi:hypothetical protein
MMSGRWRDALAVAALAVTWLLQLCRTRLGWAWGRVAARGNMPQGPRGALGGLCNTARMRPPMATAPAHGHRGRRVLRS